MPDSVGGESTFLTGLSFNQIDGHPEVGRNDGPQNSLPGRPNVYQRSACTAVRRIQPEKRGFRNVAQGRSQTICFVFTQPQPVPTAETPPEELRFRSAGAVASE